MQVVLLIPPLNGEKLQKIQESVGADWKALPQKGLLSWSQIDKLAIELAGGSQDDKTIESKWKRNPSQTQSFIDRCHDTIQLLASTAHGIF